jgi:hypothetical protein
LPDGTQIKVEKPGEEGKASAGDADDDEKKGSKEGGGDKGEKNDQKKKASPSGGQKSAGSEKE